MSSDFLGRGWKFPPATDDRGGVATTSAEDKIRESILIILGTSKGERVMRPDFGCDIHEFTFAVANANTLTMMRSAVRETLIRFEPRIDVMEVEVSTERIESGRVDIRLQYQVRATNAEANLVFPFYLKADGE
jgi:phage baseplate assembly protein W